MRSSAYFADRRVAITAINATSTTIAITAAHTEIAYVVGPNATEILPTKVSRPKPSATTTTVSVLGRRRDCLHVCARILASLG